MFTCAIENKQLLKILISYKMSSKKKNIYIYV